MEKLQKVKTTKSEKKKNSTIRNTIYQMKSNYRFI